ncbi:MAG: hypothetical protein H6Q06_2862 [Acidobacteria bacterium]|nr:hypothetical protein [Acidobacteriota bacterium]
MLRPVIRQSLLLTLVVSVFGTGSVATPLAGMKIWVVGDSTRIDPARNYEYLWLLAQKNGGREEADAIVNSIVNDFVRIGADRASLGSPGHCKHNAEDWERARIRLGDLIEKSSR